MEISNSSAGKDPVEGKFVLGRGGGVLFTNLLAIFIVFEFILTVYDGGDEYKDLHLPQKHTKIYIKSNGLYIFVCFSHQPNTNQNVPGQT